MGQNLSCKFMVLLSGEDVDRILKNEISENNPD